MNTQQVTTRDQSPNAIVALRNDLEKMETQFRFALPAHIPPARFMRVVMTAVQNNPKLLKCTRQSFFNACMKCAQDGLLPDGREAALVPFAEDDDGKAKADLAQYMPMVAGIRKKVRNSACCTIGPCRSSNRATSLIISSATIPSSGTSRRPRAGARGRCCSPTRSRLTRMGPSRAR
jgi:RecT family